jgi:hypothetical protein
VQLYQTQNRALAVTLATCGVPFARDPERDCDVPFVHLYSVDILRRMRGADGQPLFKGLPLEDAARQAFHSGRPCFIVYNFRRTELCDRVLRAYDAHSRGLTGEQSPGLPPMIPLEIEPEQAAILCAQFTHNRNIFTTGWKTAQPYLHYAGSSTEEKDGTKTVIIGSFRLVPLKL